MLLSRKGALYEIVGDFFVFFSAEKNAVGVGNGTPCASYLLVIVYHGGGALEVDDEAEIRFIETHSEGNRGDKHFNFVFYKLFFQRFPDGIVFVTFEGTVVGFGVDAVLLKPLRYLDGISYGQSKDNAASLQSGNGLCQPRQGRAETPDRKMC